MITIFHFTHNNEIHTLKGLSVENYQLKNKIISNHSISNDGWKIPFNNSKEVLITLRGVFLENIAQNAIFSLCKSSQKFKAEFFINKEKITGEFIIQEHIIEKEHEQLSTFKISLVGKLV